MVQDTMKTMIKQVIEAQQASEKLFAELEEKRTKMEVDDFGLHSLRAAKAGNL